MYIFKCPICSSPNNSDAKFCRHCGYVFSYNKGKEAEHNNEYSQKSREKSNTGRIWVIVLLVIIGIVCFIVIANNHSSYHYVSSPEAEDSVVAVVDTAVADTADADIADADATYLYVSDDNIDIEASGESKEIFVDTDGDWEISTSTANWGHLSKYSNGVTLTIDENTSSSSRSDYFEITAGSYSKRINITQQGNTEPTAEINSIWMDHSVYVNNVKGMKIHVKFNVNNMEGEKVYGYAYFYYGDNETPLHDTYGNNLKFYGYGISNYERCTFNDFTIFVPYEGLNMQPGTGSAELSFDIAITDASGNQLARKNDTQITFSR